MPQQQNIKPQEQEAANVEASPIQIRSAPPQTLEMPKGMNIAHSQLAKLQQLTEQERLEMDKQLQIEGETARKSSEDFVELKHQQALETLAGDRDALPPDHSNSKQYDHLAQLPDLPFSARLQEQLMAGLQAHLKGYQISD